MYNLQLASMKRNAYRWFSSHSSFIHRPAVTYLQKSNLRNSIFWQWLRSIWVVTLPDSVTRYEVLTKLYLTKF